MGHKNTSSVVFSHNDFLLWPWHNIDVTSLIVCTIHSKWNTKICMLNSKGKVSEPNSWTSLKLRRLLFNIAHFTYFPLVEFIWNRMLIMTKDNKKFVEFFDFLFAQSIMKKYKQNLLISMDFKFFDELMLSNLFWMLTWVNNWYFKWFVGIQ